MKFVDEFRDPAAARALVAAITDLAAGGDEFKFMEVCGGHTHTIYRHGIEHLLPPSVQLVHGPGCPVCVIPMVVSTTRCGWPNSPTSCSRHSGGT